MDFQAGGIVLPEIRPSGVKAVDNVDLPFRTGGFHKIFHGPPRSSIPQPSYLHTLPTFHEEGE